MDVDARLQLFDLKTQYQFQTAPGLDRYNMPVYAVQSSSQTIGNINYYPVYQGFLSPVYINGVQVPLSTENSTFFNIWPNVVQQSSAVITGNGGTQYSFTIPVAPQNSTPVTTPFSYLLRGHVDIGGITALANSPFGAFADPPIVTNAQAINAGPVLGSISSIPNSNVFSAIYITSNGADGSNIVVADSGQFLSGNQNFGLLMTPGQNPNGNQPLPSVAGVNYSTTVNTVNYFTGQVNVNFPVAIPSGVNINVQSYLFQTGLPRGVLFNNNVLTLRSPPDQQYLVQLDAYLTPAAYLSTANSVQFTYMSEYIARGAARKILSDTGDVEQFNFYEPFFKEQEMLVWKRSQRQFTATRTPTIYSQGINQGQQGFNTLGGSIA